MKYNPGKFTNAILLLSTALLFSLFTSFSAPVIAKAGLIPTDINAESTVDDEGESSEEKSDIPEAETVNDISDEKQMMISLMKKQMMISLMKKPLTMSLIKKLSMISLI